ncbi:MAG: PAS domain-containing sensor histidine kinase [Rhodospirillaceae bacterium]|nr:PAS domain-containing sensor histidine kinase [Rhodospirillaceae bacterium]
MTEERVMPALSPDRVVDRPKRKTFLKALVEWGRAVGFERKFAISLMVLGASLGLLTYLAVSDIWNPEEQVRTVTWLLTGDLVVSLLLATIIARRAVLLWIGRRKGLAGARLHARMVLMFGLIAVVPTIVVSVFSVAFLNYGLDTWFSERIKNAVESSLNVAQSYLTESQERIRDDTVALATELRLDGLLNISNSAQFQDSFDQELAVRSLSEAVIIDQRRRIIARGGFSLLMEFSLDIPEEAFANADRGEIVILPSATGDRVRALMLLDPLGGLYLYTGRMIDNRVLSAVRGTQDAVRLYQHLERDRSTLQLTFSVIFAVLALLLLLGAIWYAIVSASQLVKPLSRLAVAAQKIGGGDLSARVKVGVREDELSALSRTFNIMVSQLQSQQAALISANRELIDRSRLTGLILSGVSAGVIGLTENGVVDFVNRSAAELIGIDLDPWIGQPLVRFAPEMAEIAALAQQRKSGIADGQISMSRQGTTRTFHVRVVSEVETDGHTRLVVTFDDVTELLGAQRKAAWSDIARRIAHEIKNPLTPIQLAAERLKRKYLKQISDDPETFTVCTDTIIRHVGDIGRMVDEFSAFARMPAPVLRPENPAMLARETLFLQQSAHPGIEYKIDLPDPPAILHCDSSQFNRALTNLLQNAADSIEGRLEEEQARNADAPLTPGRIHLWIRVEGDALLLTVADNGKGLPKEGRERLTEPYVTTRAKGTGLGLAIVKKIMEDHGGRLLLADCPDGGAMVTLDFPLDGAQAAGGSSTTPASAAGLQIASR